MIWYIKLEVEDSEKVGIGEANWILIVSFLVQASLLRLNAVRQGKAGTELKHLHSNSCEE